MNRVHAARVDGDAWLVSKVAFAALLIGVLCLFFAVDGTVAPSATANSSAAPGATAARFAAVLWAAACCAVGGFVGFIFGIPRTLSSDTARTTVPGVDNASTSGSARAVTGAPAGTTRTQADAPDPYLSNTPTGQPPAPPTGSRADQAAGPNLAERSAPSTAVNTNLEQISDWLTKIIVGVSLVNSERIGRAMYDTAETMSATMASGKGGISLALAVMVYFGVVGLLGGYLLTRLFLQPAFNAAGAMHQSDDATSP